jgi:hypothetical protein
LFLVATRNLAPYEEIVVQDNSFVNTAIQLSASSAKDILLSLMSRLDRAETLYTDILATVDEMPVAATKLSLKKATQSLVALRKSPSILSNPETAANYRNLHGSLKELWEQNTRLEALVAKQRILYETSPATLVLGRSSTMSKDALDAIKRVDAAQDTDVQMTDSSNNAQLPPPNPPQQPTSKRPPLLSPVNTQLANSQTSISSADLSMTPIPSPFHSATPSSSSNTQVPDPSIHTRELVEKELTVETLDGKLLTYTMELEVLPFSLCGDFFNTEKYPTFQLPILK